MQSNGWNCVLWWFLQKGFYCANLVKCLACVWLFASFAKSWRHKIPLKSRKLHCKYCTAGTIISSTFIWSPTCAQGDGSILAQDLKEAVYFGTTFLSLFCFQVTQLIFKWYSDSTQVYVPSFFCCDFRRHRISEKLIRTWSRTAMLLRGWGSWGSHKCLPIEFNLGARHLGLKATLAPPSFFWTNKDLNQWNKDTACDGTKETTAKCEWKAVLWNPMDKELRVRDIELSRFICLKKWNKSLSTSSFLQIDMWSYKQLRLIMPSQWRRKGLDDSSVVMCLRLWGFMNGLDFESQDSNCRILRKLHRKLQSLGQVRSLWSHQGNIWKHVFLCLSTANMLDKSWPVLPGDQGSGFTDSLCQYLRRLELPSCAVGPCKWGKAALHAKYDKICTRKCWKDSRIYFP